MKTTLIASNIVILFLFVFALPASAGWVVDSTGDEILAGYDILQAAVETSSDAGGMQIHFFRATNPLHRIPLR